MSFYRVSGKWYHLQYSHSFSEVEEADSPKEALCKFACDVSDVEDEEEIEWEKGEPETVTSGTLTQRISFDVGADQIYQVRFIKEVQSVSAICPECNGSGVVTSYS